MTKHGYDIQAEEVFWVNQGILRSTDLRDSMDEQCIADIAACVILGQPIERSKDALDDIYSSETNTAKQLDKALESYGESKFSDEFKFCVDEIRKACNDTDKEKLRDIIFLKRTTNPFPSVFAVLVLAFHDLIVKQRMTVRDFGGLKNSLRNIAKRNDQGKKR